MRKSLVSLAALVFVHGCSAREVPSTGDAAVALDRDDARAIRKQLRSESPSVFAAFATGKPGSLPFATTPITTTSFAPNVGADHALIDPPTPSSVATTKIVPALIAPMADRSGRYVMRRGDSATFFVDDGLTFSLLSPDRGWGLHMSVVGARSGSLVAEQPQSAKVHQYVGTSSKWATDLPTYARVAWEEILPGVDMAAEPVRGGVAYRFVLSPGARVEDVRLRWDGGTSIALTADARGVDVSTEIGKLQVRGLRAFRVEGTQRTELPARHVLRDGAIGVEVDEWDGRAPLIIDPTITWSTFLGGSGVDSAVSAVLGSYSYYLGAQTASADYPKMGAYDTTLGGTADAAVTRFTETGAITWSTYLGGGSSDQPRSISVNRGTHYVAVVGYTTSTDFPTTSGLDQTLDGGDAFVTELTGSGTLAYSTFLGGSGNDDALGVYTAGSGLLYVTGLTTSADFPTKSESLAVDTTRGGLQDAFLVKVGSGGIRWSTFIGGSDTDTGFAVAEDSTTNYVYVVGTTQSSDFATTGAYDTTLGGTVDGFVARYTYGGAKSWHSYLGGSGDDAVRAIYGGRLIVVGDTSSSNFPIVGSGADNTLGGTQDAFVASLSEANGAPIWSTFLGGGGQDSARAVASLSEILITGRTTSTDFPLKNAFDENNAGTDAFFASFSTTGSMLTSTYLGGAGTDEGIGVLPVPSGGAVVAGTTTSSDFATTTGAFDTTLGGTSDAFFTKIVPATLGLGAACTPGACLSGYCVDGYCCDKPCAGTCEACSAAKKGSGSNGICGFIGSGRNPDLECAPPTCDPTTATAKLRDVCNGSGGCMPPPFGGMVSCAPYGCAGTACGTTCTSDTDCVANGHCTAGKCVNDLTPGTPCTRPAQCYAGFCVDGYCCTEACTSDCKACSAALKGSGSNGVCEPVAADTDPKNKCAVVSGTCAAPGACDGAGSCRSFAKAGTGCGTTSCAGGVVTGKVCKGDSATCVDSTGISCAPYGCGTTACKTSCDTDADCATDAFCTTTKTCATKRTNGASCGEGRECKSTHCADGVCCNVACAGQCESCKETASPGTCIAVTGDPRMGHTACKGAPCVGRCDGLNPASCTYEVGKECGSTCLGNTQQVSQCDTTGACVAAPAQPCNGYACDGNVRCRADCATDADCTENYKCVASKCERISARCSEDGRSSINEADGSKTTLCAPYRCDTTNSSCKGSCVTDSDCVDGNVCSSTDRCEPPAAPSASDEPDCGCHTPGRGARSSPFLVALLAIGIRALRRRP